MNVQIDRTKVYTSGEWVHGTVALHSSILDVKEVTVELWGVLSCVEIDSSKADSLTYNTELYSVIDLKTPDTTKHDGGVSFNFAIRYPGHECDDFLKLPASVVSWGVLETFEIHHLITVSVLVLGPQKKSLEHTVELKFMPSLSISCLLEPSMLHHMPSFGGLPVAANIHLPRFLAQGRAVNTVKVELMYLEKPGYEVLSIEAWLNLNISNQGECVYEEMVEVTHKRLSKNWIQLSMPDIFDKSPAFSLSGVKLGYELRLVMTVAESHNQKHHEVVFSKPVDLLPTFLYKSDRLDFARPDEVMAMSKRIYQGLTGSMISTLLGDQPDSTTTAPGMVSDNPATDTTSPPKYCESH